MLDGLEPLGLEGDIGRAQVREGLRRLEGLPAAAAQGSSRDLKTPDLPAPASRCSSRAEAAEAVPRVGVQLQVEERAEKSPHSAHGGARKGGASTVLEDLSMQDGALAPALNSFVKLLWPRVNEYVHDLIYKDIQPMIDAALPSMVHVKFTKVSLGNSSPSLGPLTVEHHPENNDIELHIGIKLVSDLDVELTAAGIPVGITKLRLEGTLVCLFAPLTSTPPFFGGIQIFFPNPPEVLIHFVGVAKVAHVPGIRRAVRGAVADGIAGVLVLPRRIAVDLDEEDKVDITDLTYPEPTAVLRVTLLCASGLAASDMSLFGNATSDPYVVATLGCKTWTSPTVAKSLNPVWGEEGRGLVVDFLVHSDRQALSLKVFDYDFVLSDDLIGVAEPLAVHALGTASKRGEVMRHVLPLTSSSGAAGAGKLCLTTEVLALTGDRAAARMEGPSVGHLSVKLLRATGLGGKAEFPFKVRVRVLGAEALVEAAPGEAAGEAEPSGAGCGFLRAATREIANLAKCGSAPKEGRSASKDRSASKEEGGPASKEAGAPAPKEGETAPRQVRAESLSAASTPPDEKQLAEALQSVCAELAARGDTTEEIARVLSVDAQEVQAFLTSRGDTPEADRVAREAAAQRAASRPFFGEVAQLLLPAVEDTGIVELTLLDKYQRVLGAAELPMQQLLGAEGLRLEGPFELSSVDSVPGSPGSKVSLEGSLWLKWLS